MGIKAGMKIPLQAIFGTHNVGDGIRYFCMTVFAGCVWPLCFRKLNRLADKRKV